MVWMILIAIVVFVVVIREEGGFVMSALLALIAGGGMGLIVALLAGVIWMPGIHTERARPAALQSLADGGMSVHGGFFLGSGTINSESVYTWYEKTGPNTYVQRHVDVDNSNIHYLPSGNNHPYYVRSFAVDNAKGGLKAFKLVLSEADTYYDTYDFYIPRGSIIQSYRLDSQ